MPSTTVYADTVFGYVTSAGIDGGDGPGAYADVREAVVEVPAITQQTADTANNPLVGQKYVLDTGQAYFYCYESFLRFRNFPERASARVTVATIYVYVETDSSTTDFTIRAREYDFGAAVTAADYIKGSELSADTLLASKSTAGGVAGYIALTSEAALITRLPWVARNGLSLSSSRHEGANEPAGDEYVTIGKPGGANPPYIVLTYEDDTDSPFLGTGKLHVHVGATPTEYNTSATGVYFSSTMPGGESSAGFVIPSTDAFTPLTELAQDAKTTLVYDPTGDNITLWDGWVANNPEAASVGPTAQFNVECGGTFYKATYRQDFCRTFADSELGHWYEHPDNNKNLTLNNEGRLLIRAEKTSAYGASAAAAWCYQLDGGMSDDSISYVTMTYQTQLEGDWKVRLVCSDSYPDDISGTNDFESATVAHTHVWVSTSTTGSTTATFACDHTGLTTPRYLYLYLINDGVADNPAANVWVKLEDVIVYGSGTAGKAITGLSIANPTVITCTGHGLVNGDQIYIAGTDSTPAVGTNANGVGGGSVYTVTKVNDNTFTVPVNVTGAGTTGYWHEKQTWTTDTIMADIGTDTGLAVTTDTATIGSALTQAVIEPFTTRADAVDALAQTAGEAVDWAWWGTQFYAKPRPAVGDIPAAQRYIIDAEEPGVIYEVTSAAEGLPAAVRVVYQSAADGVYPDGWLANAVRASDPGSADDRVALLDLSGDGPIGYTAAINAADAYLENMGATLYSGTITYQLPYIRKYGGGWKLAAAVKAGDFVGCLQVAAHTATPMQIVGTDYDIDSMTLTMTVGSVYSLRSHRVIPRKTPTVVQGTPFAPGKGFPG